MSNSLDCPTSTNIHYGDFPLRCSDNSGLFDLSGVWDGDKQLTNYDVMRTLFEKSGNALVFMSGAMTKEAQDHNTELNRNPQTLGCPSFMVGVYIQTIE